MAFRFPISFMYLTPGPCESLGRVRKLTMGLEQDFCPFPLLLIHLCFYVLTQVASPGEETGAGKRTGEVKETSITAKTD
jgi:hypothetical protein